MSKNLALLAAAPCLGALFVIFLPIAGFALLGLAIYEKAMGDRKVLAHA